MIYKPTKDIPIPSDVKAPDSFWDLETLTEYGMSNFYPDRTVQQAQNAATSFKTKQSGKYKKRAFTSRAAEMPDGDKIVKGVRVWRIDKNIEEPPIDQNARIEDSTEEPNGGLKRGGMTTTDINKALKGSSQ